LRHASLLVRRAGGGPVAESLIDLEKDPAALVTVIESLSVME
jgi:hypothetical protein